jgi:carbon monoxide dehydrogenase subunit G
MKITGSATVAAPPAEVYRALNDPAVLVRTIPGCQRLEEVAPDNYAMTVTAGVASIKGTYLGEVVLSDPRPPESFVLRAKGQGAPGTVDATVTVRLAATELATGGGTTVEYDADAVVGGMIGGVGQRMIGSVAKKTAGEFFAAVEQAINAPEPAASGSPVHAPATPGQPGRAVYEAPAKRPRVAFAPSAVGMGAAVALAGVVVGFVLGRI